jgi:hypothetical protein
MLAYTTSPAAVKCKFQEGQERPGTLSLWVWGDRPRQRPVGEGLCSGGTFIRPRAMRSGTLSLSPEGEGFSIRGDAVGRLGQVGALRQALRHATHPLEVEDDHDLAIDQHQPFLAHFAQGEIDVH